MKIEGGPLNIASHSGVGRPKAHRMPQFAKAVNGGFVLGCEEGIAFLSANPSLNVAACAAYEYYKPGNAVLNSIALASSEMPRSEGKRGLVIATEAFKAIPSPPVQMEVFEIS